MNWQHFRAFIWLRYRVLYNQTRRAGVVATVITGVAVAFCLLLSAGAFGNSLLLGIDFLPRASPVVHLLVWDGLVSVFLFFWVLVLLSELQRSEALSLDKFLHLPVSLSGVFLVNYLSSLVNLRLVVFVPAMVGLILGMTISRGAVMLVCLPLLASFLLMVTAVTYQFQGWLAAMMSNQRRRRSLVIFITLTIVVLAQVPNAVMQYGLQRHVRATSERIEREGEETKQEIAANSQKIQDLQRDASHISKEDYKRRDEEIKKAVAATAEKLTRMSQRDVPAEEFKRAAEVTWQMVDQTARVVNWCVPLFWLPLGVADVAEGNLWPALLATLTFGLVGTVSLRRAYRTTLRLYTGQVTTGGSRVVKAALPAKPGRERVLLVERKIPWLSEQAAAVALACFRSLLRAPEAKLMLITPLVMGMVFGAMFLGLKMPRPDGVGPWITFLALALVLLGMISLMGNMFGFDRTAFRSFVLCGAPRRDILLGKNLAFAPLAGVLGGLLVAGSCFVFPTSAANLLAAVPQAVSMYLMVCMLTNWIAILAPIAIPAGTMRPGNVKLVPVLLHIAFTFTFPLVMAPVAIPILIDLALRNAGWLTGVPVYLLLMSAECAIIIVLYSQVLNWQARVLQNREQKILEVVTSRAE